MTRKLPFLDHFGRTAHRGTHSCMLSEKLALHLRAWSDQRRGSLWEAGKVGNGGSSCEREVRCMNQLPFQPQQKNEGENEFEPPSPLPSNRRSSTKKSRHRRVTLKEKIVTRGRSSWQRSSSQCTGSSEGREETGETDGRTYVSGQVHHLGILVREKRVTWH